MAEAHLFLFDMERLWKFDGTLLGARFETAISAQGIRLHLPSKLEGPYPQFAQVGSPAFPGETRDSPAPHDAPADYWGRVTEYSATGIDINSFETQVLVLEFMGQDERLRPEVHDWARLNLNNWCTSVTRWIEYLANQVSDLQARRRNSPVSQNIETWTRDRGTWLEPLRSVEVQCGVGIGNTAWGSALNRQTFEIALESAEQYLTPPVEHLFLCTARTSFLAREYRKSVLEAAVAVEGLLRKLLNEFEIIEYSIRGREAPEVIEKMSLGSLIDCATEIIPNWPRRVGTEMVRIRNMAAHQSVEVLEQKAFEFLAMATQVVSCYSPKIELNFIPRAVTSPFD